MSGSVRCPNCGHVLFAIELPIAPSVPARDASPPDAPLLLRVGEAAQLLGVSSLRRCAGYGRAWDWGRTDVRPTATESPTGGRTLLFTGEVEMRGEEVSGLAVHAAARVMAAARDGEVVVSDALRAAIRTNEVHLSDRGRHELKGVPGDWQLYVVEANAGKRG